MGKLKGDLGYLSQKIMQQETELKAVEEKLLQTGFAQTAYTPFSNPVKRILLPKSLS